MDDTYMNMDMVCKLPPGQEENFFGQHLSRVY